MFLRRAKHLFTRIALVAGCLLVVAMEPGVAAGPVAPITRVADIRRLSREDAAKGLPVEISGVSMWTGLGGVVIHDGGQSIWVDCNLGRLSGRLGPAKVDIQPGSHLEVTGVTDPGGYAPMVLPTAIHRRGTLPLVPAKRVPVDALIAGNEDGQPVEIDGVVQEYVPDKPYPRHVEISLITDGHYCRVIVADGTGLTEAAVVDSRVRLRGIFAPDYNARAEAVGLKLLVNSAADTGVLAPAPADPFLSPRVSLHRLAPFSPDARPWHRKVTSGTVSFAQPGAYFFLQDGGTGVRVSSSARDVRPGQRVEVAGFVEWFDSIAAMKNALVRPMGAGAVPEPLPVTAATLLDPQRHSARSSSLADPACRMVRLKGSIQRIEWDAPGRVKVLRIDSDGWGFPAYLPLANELNGGQMKSWVPGAVVEVTGICELKFGGGRDSKRSLVPVAFHLLMSSPAAVKVLQVPPWWTMERLRVALAAGGCVALLLFIWSWSLRRQVRRQSRIIGDKIAAEAVHAERSRIARDLHDSIEQQLTGVSMHLYGASSSMSSDPQSAAGALELARRMLKHTQRETRNSIRDLRTPLLERRGLGDALRDFAEQSSSATGPVVEAHITGEPGGLPPDAQYQLLRLCQEALGNALKHAKANRITIELAVHPETTTLAVTDDGCGFRPDILDASDPSHFGMLGMRERAAKIGAKLEITSAPGKGTTVTVTLPAAAPSP